MNKHHTELVVAARSAITELSSDETVDMFETADDLRGLIDLCYDTLNKMGPRADKPKKKGRRR